MLPTDHLLAFLLTVYVLILIPGPSVLLVVSRGVALGRRAALATVLGNATGLALQLVLVVIGVGSILARSDAVFTTVKLIGAAYLVLLGVRSIRDRKQLASALSPAAAAPRSAARIVREGFVVELGRRPDADRPGRRAGADVTQELIVRDRTSPTLHQPESAPPPIRGRRVEPVPSSPEAPAKRT